MKAFAMMIFSLGMFLYARAAWGRGSSTNEVFRRILPACLVLLALFIIGLAFVAKRALPLWSVLILAGSPYVVSWNERRLKKSKITN
jgi:hypothetical protein